jgi:hypothetical protein
MATQLQIRRGTSTQVAAFTGAEGEIVVNTTNDSVHVNDGSTAGGFEMARADLNNVSDTSLNAALTGNTVSALTITTLTLGSTAITATGTELNYVDGVTSAIQTQIDTKAPLASPTFTGTATMGGLEIATSASDIGVDLKLDGNKTSNGAIGSIIFENNGDSVGMIRSNRASANDAADMLFYTQATGGANTQRMAITSAGDVKIGTGVDRFSYLTASTANLQIGGGVVFDAGSGNDVEIFNYRTSAMLFGNGGDEDMRLDSSRNLLVGKTTAAIATAGTFIGGGSNVGLVEITRDNNRPLRINRTSSDGQLVRFDKDGTNVGSIGTVSDSLYIASPYGNDSGLRFSDRVVHPCTTTGAPRDDAINLGYAQGRFDTVFAKAGSINTSDRNEKQDIEALSDAEQRVAVAAKSLLRKYRWKSAVAEKGDDARIHFGIIAQDLQDAFTAEGLNAAHYGMWCSDTWTDEETGEERSRMGVRYSELLAFIISAI